MIRYAEKESSNGLVFVDTEALTTMLYAKKYLPDHEDQELDEINTSVYFDEFNMYILLPPVIPWDDDGTRIMSDFQEREKFYNDLKDGMAIKSGIVFEPKSTDRKQRVIEVSDKITEHLFDSHETINYTIK